MIRFNPNDPYYPPEMAHAFDSFHQTIELISKIYQSKGPSPEDQELIDMQRQNLRQVAAETPHPTIQRLALKILEKAESLGTLTETDLSDFLSQEILLQDFTPSKSAQETVIETLEGHFIEPPRGTPIKEVLWIQDDTPTLLSPSELTSRLQRHLIPLLGADVFASLMQDCISFFQEHQEYLGEGYDLIHLEPTHLVIGASKRTTTLTLSGNSLMIQGYDVFKVQSDDADTTGSENYIATRLNIELPLNQLGTAASWDMTTRGLKTDYKISKLFSSKESAQAFLSRIDQAQEDLMPNFTPPRNPKKELLSILKESAKKSEEKALQQLMKDLHRIGDITFQGNERTLMFPTPESGQEENVINQLSQLLGTQSSGYVDEKLGRLYLSKIADLLSQTPWANLTEGIQRYPMHRIQPSLYEAFVSTEELSKQIPDIDNPIFLLAEEQSIRIKKSESYTTIENSCVFNFQHAGDPTHRFVSIKVIAQLPDQTPLDPSKIEAAQFVSHVCETKEEALMILPLLQTVFPKKPSEAMETASGLPPTSQRRNLPPPHRERENLQTTARGRFIQQQTQALNQEQAKDARKGQKSKEA